MTHFFFFFLQDLKRTLREHLDFWKKCPMNCALIGCLIHQHLSILSTICLIIYCFIHESIVFTLKLWFPIIDLLKIFTQFLFIQFISLVSQKMSLNEKSDEKMYSPNCCITMKVCNIQHYILHFYEIYDVLTLFDWYRYVFFYSIMDPNI